MKYTIKEGRHYHSNKKARLYDFLCTQQRSSIRATIMISENCWYDKSYIVNTGYNKLFGAGMLAHQVNSARFVWNPDYENKGRFNIYAYTYNNGVWSAEFLGTVSAGQWFTCEIVSTGTTYEYFLDDDAYTSMPCPNPKLTKILQPYFGGQDTAYRDMHIHIKNIRW